MPLFGNPSYAEVDELIAAKHATIEALDAAAAKVLPAWSARDAAAASAWHDAWVALVGRYNAATALRVPSPGSLAIPPEVVWHAILHALRQAWDPTGSLTQSPPESPGDLVALSRELGAQGAEPDFSSVPQPVVPDRDLQMFQAADVVVKLATGAFNFAPLLLMFLLARALDRRS